MAINNRTCQAFTAIVSLLAIGFLLPASAQSSDVERLFASAIQLHEAGDIDGAIRGYQAILRIAPQRADVRSNLGAAYSRLGRYEEAIDQYKQALGADTTNHMIRLNLGLAYYKAGLFREAANELTRFMPATNEPTQKTTAILVLADCQVRLGEYKEVIQLLTPLADADPGNRMLAYLLGSALIGDGQLNRGQEVIDRVFRDDNSAEARLLMGSILLLADDAQVALKEFERAIELNPKLPALQAWYGRTLMRLGDSEKAKVAFKTELVNNANDFDANVFFGILLRQDKMFDEAFNYLSRAVQLRPRDQYARYHLAAVYAGLGKPAEALPLLEAVVSEFKEFVEARVLLASVYYKLNRKADGDREQAIIQRLNAEEQAKQPGAQDGKRNVPPKQPENSKNNRQPSER